MSELLFRYMTAEDVLEVSAIEKDTFSLPWSSQSFLDALNNADNIYCVCELDGRIAGYVGVWTSFDEGNITNVAVSREHRRNGVARGLLLWMEEQAKKRDVTKFFLEVRQSNEGARALYQGLGYEEIGIRKRFYEHPVEDAVIMMKHNIFV